MRRCRGCPGGVGILLVWQAEAVRLTDCPFLFLGLWQWLPRFVSFISTVRPATVEMVATVSDVICLQPWKWLPRYFAVALPSLLSASPRTVAVALIL